MVYRVKVQYLGGFPNKPGRHCTQSEVRLQNGFLEFHCIGVLTVVNKPLFKVRLGSVKSIDHRDQLILVHVQNDGEDYQIQFKTDGNEPGAEADGLADAIRLAGSRQITETRCTCSACGKVWHYGKADALMNQGKAMQQVGKSIDVLYRMFPRGFHTQPRGEGSRPVPELRIPGSSEGGCQS